MVRAIIATQAREGRVTTREQAEAAYDKVRALVLAGKYPWCARDYAPVEHAIERLTR